MIASGTSILCAFTYGFVMPLVIPPEGYVKLTDLYSESPFGVITNILLAVVFYGIVTGMICGFVLMSQGRPPIIRVLVKVCIFAMTASSFGSLVVVVAGCLGIYRTPWVSPNIVLFCACMSLMVGCAGVSTLLWTGKYRNILS